MINQKFKTIIIPKSILIKFIFINKKKFLIFISSTGVNKYFLIPNYFSIKKEKFKLIFNFSNSLSLKKKENTKFFDSTQKYVSAYKHNIFFVLNNLLHLCKSFKKKCFKILIIRGAGLKVTFKDNNCLQLKLGFSHLIYLSIPKTIVVSILKKKVIIEGYNQIEVYNYSHKLKNLKPLNLYTGKGFFLKSDNKIELKEIKKI